MRFRLRCGIGGLAIATLALLVSVDSATGHTPHDTVGSVAFSPDFAEDGTAYVTTQINGMFRTTDGGDTWWPLSNGIDSSTVRVVAVSPVDARRVLISSIDGVFVSEDRGDTWAHADTGLGEAVIASFAMSAERADLVLARSTFGGLFRSDDGARTWEPVTTGGFVAAVEFAASGDRAVLGTPAGSIKRSTDGGATWGGEVALGTEDAIDALEVAGAGDGLVLAGGSGGRTWISHDGGDTFAPGSGGLPDEEILDFELSPDFADDGVAWVSMWTSGPFRSDDEGVTWAAVGEGLTTDPQAPEIGFPQFSGIEAATTADGSLLVLLSGYDGLFASSDGSTWTPSELLADMVTGIAISPAFATDRTVVVTSYVNGAHRSTDGGATFERVNEGLLRDDVSQGNKLLPIVRLHNVAMSPGFADDRTVFSATWTALLKSTDGASSWESHRVAPDPADSPLRQFVIGVSPAFAVDGTIYLGTRQGDLYRSVDRGEQNTFDPIWTFDARVRSVVLSPEFAEDHTMFVGTETGVFRSLDAGESWAPSGPTDLSMVAISPGYGADRTVFAGTTAGLFVTRDGGDGWNPVTDTPWPSGASVAAIALSPDFANDTTMLVSIYGAGLFRSTDAGTTFDAVGDDLRAENRLIADFSNPTDTAIEFSPTFTSDDTIFAYAGQNVLRSTDLGESWTVLALPLARDFDVTPASTATDPVDPVDPATTEPVTDSPATTTTSVAAPDGPGADSDSGSGGAVALGVAALVALGAAIAVATRRRRQG